MIKPIKRFLQGIKSFSARVYAAFDVRDWLTYGGLFSIGYGFHLFMPWLGYVAFGVVSMLLGLGWIIRIPKNG